jgi:hypothetical protein
MSSDLLWLFWPAVALACGIQAWRIHRRRRSLARTGVQCSLSYRPRDSLDLAGRYFRLRLFQQGHDRLVGHVLAGPTPVGPVKLFSYGYDLGFGGGRRHMQWIVAVLETLRDHPIVHAARPSADLLQGRLWGSEGSPGTSGIQVCSPQDVPENVMETLRAWFERSNEQYQVELAGRFIAIYASDDRNPPQIPRVLEDLQALGTALESIDPI